MSLGYKKIKFVLGEIICIMGLDYHTYVALAHFAEMYNVERLAFGITRKLLCLTIQRWYQDWRQLKDVICIAKSD